MKKESTLKSWIDMSSIRKIIKFINPRPPIGGLSIEENSIKFVVSKGGQLIKINVPLVAGVIEEGRVKNKVKFLEALIQVRKELGQPSVADKIFAIVSISPHNIYTQSFSLPPLEKAKLIEDAAKLNLQLISPIDINSAYFDWEKIGNPELENEKLELLGAFVPRGIIDDILAVLKEVGIWAVAVEFSSLSMARLIKESSIGLDLNKPYIALAVSEEGLNFLILRGGRLYFHYFVSWNAVQSRQISIGVFNNVISQEVKKIITFYSTHWNDQIGDLVLVAKEFQEEIKNIIQSNFPSINVQFLNLQNRFSEFTSDWYISLGSLIRGEMPRVKDTAISLMAIGTEERFLEERTLMLIRIWRSIVITSMIFVAIALLLGDSLLYKVSLSLDKQFDNFVARADMSEISKLNEQAKQFNQLVNKATIAKSKKSNLSSFYEMLNNLAGSSVSFKKITYSKDTKAVSIIASAASEEQAINFKDKLESQSNIKSVSLPLAQITTEVDGSVSFVVTFSLTE